MVSITFWKPSKFQRLKVHTQGKGEGQTISMASFIDDPQPRFIPAFKNQMETIVISHAMLEYKSISRY